MITIADAGYSHGYSGHDHLLDDSALKGLIGRDFPSVKAARAAANRVEKSNPKDRRCNTSPIYLEVILPNGEKVSA